jgi:hypothetical protein
VSRRGGAGSFRDIDIEINIKDYPGFRHVPGLDNLFEAYFRIHCGYEELKREVLSTFRSPLEDGLDILYGLRSDDLSGRPAECIVLTRIKRRLQLLSEEVIKQDQQSHLNPADRGIAELLNTTLAFRQLSTSNAIKWHSLMSGIHGRLEVIMTRKVEEWEGSFDSSDVRTSQREKRGRSTARDSEKPAGSRSCGRRVSRPIFCRFL